MTFDASVPGGSLEDGNGDGGDDGGSGRAPDEGRRGALYRCGSGVCGRKFASDCYDVGDMEEYVGYKIDYENISFMLTQPGMVQSFMNEFDMDNCVPTTTGEPGMTPVKSE